MPKIIELENNSTAEYNEKDVLGPGVSAVVYRGEQQIGDGSQVTVAIKVPRNANFEENIQHEFDNLSQLEAKTRELHPQGFAFTPVVALGTHEQTNHRVLVMPVYEQQLVKLCRQAIKDGNFIQAEQLLTKGMIEFTWATQALHNLGYTCPDRKIGDFFLATTDSPNQLAVIDWGVYREYGAVIERGDGTEVESASAEMDIVGRLVHEMFTLSKGGRTYVPTRDENWRISTPTGMEGLEQGVISIGLRYILRNMVIPSLQYKDKTSDPDHPLPSAEKLRGAFEAWQTALNADPNQLAAWRDDPAYVLFANGEPDLSPQEQQLALQDLIWRHTGAEADLAMRTQLLEMVADTKSERLKEVIKHLDREDRSNAQATVETALSELDNLPANEVDYVEWGKLKRWNDLYFPLFGRRRIGSNFEGKLRQVFDLLSRNLAEDTSASLKAIDTDIENIKENADKPEDRERLDALQNEIDIRLIAQEINRHRDDTNNASAEIDRLERLITKISRSPYMHPEQAIRADMGHATIVGEFIGSPSENLKIAKERASSETLAQQQTSKIDELIAANRLEEAKKAVHNAQRIIFIGLPENLESKLKRYDEVIQFCMWAQELAGRIQANQESARLIRELLLDYNQIAKNLEHDPTTLRSIAKEFVINVLNTAGEQVLEVLAPNKADWRGLREVEPLYPLLNQDKMPPSIQKAKARYEEVEAFYKRWVPDILTKPSNPISPYDPSNEDAVRESMRKLIDSKMDELTMLRDEANEKGINLNDLLEQIKVRENLGDTNVTMEQVLAEGYKAIIEKQSAEAIRNFTNDIVQEHKKLVRELSETQESANRALEDTKRKTAELSKTTQSVESQQELSRKLNQQKIELQTLHQRMERLQANQDQLEHAAVQLQQIETIFKQEKVNGLRSAVRIIDDLLNTADDMDEYGAQNPKMSHIIRNMAMMWDSRIKQYRILKDTVDENAAQLRHFGDKPKRADAPKISVLATKLRDVMQATDPIVFRLYEQEWEQAISQTFERLAACDPKNETQIQRQKIEMMNQKKKFHGEMDN